MLALSSIVKYLRIIVVFAEAVSAQCQEYSSFVASFEISIKFAIYKNSIVVYIPYITDFNHRFQTKLYQKF